MSYEHINLPIIDVNEEEATITERLFKDGDSVKKGDIILVVENTKATKDVIATKNGYILYQCKEFDTRKNGDTIAVIFDSIDELNRYKEENDRGVGTDKVAGELAVSATKKAIALAEKLGINISDVVAEKGGGLIKEKDVELYAASVGNNSMMNDAPNFTLKRERVVIIGAGNGAEVVIDILLDYPDVEIVGLVDDNVKVFRNYNIPVLDCGIKDFPDKYGSDFYDSVIISIGANLKSMGLRRSIFEKYKAKGVKFTNAIAKSAEIRRGAQIGEGNIIGAGCYIGTLTKIGDNNSISYGANIGHHNIVGSHNLIAPGVFTSGADKIGDSCIIPAGVSIINRVSIGDKVIVPIGYAVSQSIEDGKIIKINENIVKRGN